MGTLRRLADSITFCGRKVMFIFWDYVSQCFLLNIVMSYVTCRVSEDAERCVDNNCNCKMNEGYANAL